MNCIEYGIEPCSRCLGNIAYGRCWIEEYKVMLEEPGGTFLFPSTVEGRIMYWLKQAQSYPSEIYTLKYLNATIKTYFPEYADKFIKMLVLL